MIFLNLVCPFCDLAAGCLPFLETAWSEAKFVGHLPVVADWQQNVYEPLSRIVAHFDVLFLYTRSVDNHS